MVQSTGPKKIKCAVFISGTGSNLESLINFSKKKNSPISIKLIISDNEMYKTFNCGVGFCLIINQRKLNRVKKFFTKKYKPYVIGKILKGRNKIRLNGKINWEKKN